MLTYLSHVSPISAITNVVFKRPLGTNAAKTIYWDCAAHCHPCSPSTYHQLPEATTRLVPRHMSTISASFAGTATYRDALGEPQTCKDRSEREFSTSIAKLMHLFHHLRLKTTCQFTISECRSLSPYDTTIGGSVIIPVPKVYCFLRRDPSGLPASRICWLRRLRSVAANRLKTAGSGRCQTDFGMALSILHKCVIILLPIVLSIGTHIALSQYRSIYGLSNTPSSCIRETWMHQLCKRRTTISWL